MKTTETYIDSPRKRWYTMVFVVAAVLLAAAGAALVLQTLENPVKGIDVTALQAVTIRNPQTKVTLHVEPQRWSSLVQNFRSSSSNLGSKSWPVLAEIEFLFQDGQSRQVTVYSTGAELGSFRIGNSTYTGGDERLLIQMMDDEFRRQKRELQIPRANPR